MGQFRGIKVVATAGSPRVYQMYRANGTLGGSGTFTQGGALTWSGGSGFYWFDNGAVIEFWHTTGSNPAVGSVLTQGSRTFTIASFPSENLVLTAPVAAYPALFSTTGGSQGPIAQNDEFFVDGEPTHIVSATIGPDYFDLTENWSGTSPLRNVEAVINRDRTSIHGWPIPEPGSRIPWSVLKETLRQIDADVVAGGGASPPGSWTALTLNAVWRNVGGSYPSTAWCKYPGSNLVELRGYVDTNGSAVSSNSIIVTNSNGLPSGARPLSRRDFSYAGETFAIHPDGAITWTVPDQTSIVPGAISLSCVFRADGS